MNFCPTRAHIQKHTRRHCSHNKRRTRMEKTNEWNLSVQNSNSIIMMKNTREFVDSSIRAFFSIPHSYLMHEHEHKHILWVIQFDQKGVAGFQQKRINRKLFEGIWFAVEERQQVIRSLLNYKYFNILFRQMMFAVRQTKMSSPANGVGGVGGASNTDFNLYPVRIKWFKFCKISCCRRCGHNSFVLHSFRSRSMREWSSM